MGYTYSIKNPQEAVIFFIMNIIFSICHSFVELEALLHAPPPSQLGRVESAHYNHANDLILVQGLDVCILRILLEPIDERYDGLLLGSCNQ